MIRPILVAAAVTIGASSHAGSPPDPTGVWVRSDGGSRVRIARCGGNICATNLWIRDPDGGEAVGDVLVMNIKPQSESLLAGTAFDRKRDLTYSMTMILRGPSLTTRGCVLAGIICKNVLWTRAR